MVENTHLDEDHRFYGCSYAHVDHSADSLSHSHVLAGCTLNFDSYSSTNVDGDGDLLAKCNAHRAFKRFAHILSGVDGDGTAYEFPDTFDVSRSYILCNEHALAHAYAHAYEYPYTNPYADAHCNRNCHGHRYDSAQPLPHSYAHSNPLSYTDDDRDADAYGNGHSDPDPYSYVYPNPYGYTYTHGDGYTDEYGTARTGDYLFGDYPFG